VFPVLNGNVSNAINVSVTSRPAVYVATCYTYVLHFIMPANDTSLVNIGWQFNNSHAAIKNYVTGIHLYVQ